MQRDMHYYGTYALARAAGIRADCARTVATACEFVDDSIATQVIVHPDGARFRGEPTAHHTTLPEYRAMSDPDDQLQVWLPFHFLPGNDGTTQSQRLVCRTDSPIARDMVTHHLGECERPYALQLLGIAAHVYADTFAHFGFSGLSSRVNRVAIETIATKNAQALLGPMMDKFFRKFGAQGTLLDTFTTKVLGLGAQLSTGALGHGSVATCPDQPYLEWSYEYEVPDHAGRVTVERQNIKDFERGAEALHGMFRDFASRRKLFADGTGGVDYADVRATVRQILETMAASEDRAARWRAALEAGAFTRGRGELMREYALADWYEQTLALKDLEKPEMASSFPVYQFHQAAALHRDYVLRQLLPKHNIYVI